MIVSEDQARCCVGYRRGEHFSGMNERRVEESHSYSTVAEYPILRVEVQHPEFFLLPVAQQRSQPLEHIPGTADPISTPRRFGSQSTADLESRRDRGSTCWTDAGNRAKFRRLRHAKASQGATKARQNLRSKVKR